MFTRVIKKNSYNPVKPVDSLLEKAFRSDTMCDAHGQSNLGLVNKIVELV